ncbi:hypothetical protein [uncultured Chitinophaga sp.]|uniref:hypothetical protein n=1 Tax=uncultured Chitinophaga sp. TaxID=339340 RepID=UPI0026093E88|nr:hypothetical protein [uncultured Chitinophaga sp.]
MTAEKFVKEFSKLQTSGQQTFIERTTVYPGDTVVAEIRLSSPEQFAGQLKEGITFDFLEGARIIGKGKIQQIVNNRLRKAHP